MMRRKDAPKQKKHKSYTLKWLGMKFIIDVYKTDDEKHKLYWIWKEDTPDVYALRAVIPVVSGKPILSAGQLAYGFMLGKLKAIRG